MKHCFRITKYDPKYRDEKGIYRREEWTSISDVGRVYEGKTFKMEEYFRVENLYLNAITCFMKCLNVSLLMVKSLEREREIPEELINNELGQVYEGLQEGDLLDLGQIRSVARLNLRGDIWCKLVSKGKMRVVFSYDYYMNICSEQECPKAINDIIESGMFVEIDEREECL